MKKVIIIILLIFVLSGCGANEDFGFRLDGDNVSEVNYRSGNKTDPNSYFMKLNMPKTNKNDQSSVVDKAREVIYQGNLFKAGPIQMIGEMMYITVYPEDHLTNGQKRGARLELRKDLERALPSYHINVKVENQ